jgi:hypothetical protein
MMSLVVRNHGFFAPEQRTRAHALASLVTHKARIALSRANGKENSAVKSYVLALEILHLQAIDRSRNFGREFRREFASTTELCCRYRLIALHICEQRLPQSIRRDRHGIETESVGGLFFGLVQTHHVQLTETIVLVYFPQPYEPGTFVSNEVQYIQCSHSAHHIANRSTDLSKDKSPRLRPLPSICAVRPVSSDPGSTVVSIVQRSFRVTLLHSHKLSLTGRRPNPPSSVHLDTRFRDWFIRAHTTPCLHLETSDVRTSICAPPFSCRIYTVPHVSATSPPYSVK